MGFEVDLRIQESGVLVGDLQLSSVYLKNESQFPWVILVPRQESIREIYQLSRLHQHILMDEISILSHIVEDYFKPDKLNIGALGNMVTQLHIHIVGRFKNDSFWPEGIWQKALEPRSYSQNIWASHVQNLQQLLRHSTS